MKLIMDVLSFSARRYPAGTFSKVSCTGWTVSVRVAITGFIVGAGTTGAGIGIAGASEV